MNKILVLFIVLVLVPLPAHALRMQDNMHFTILRDGLQCVDVLLPDDAGVYQAGTFEYLLTMEPGPSLTWGDLSEQIVRTDENNTVLIPICFSGPGLGPGNCSEPFTLNVQVPLLDIEETFSGGVCVSEYLDLDFGEGDSWGVLTLDSDVFDIGFLDDLIYSRPGEVVELELSVQSHAEIGLDLEVLSSLAVSPQVGFLSLGPSSPAGTMTFSLASPPEEGEHTITVRAAIRDCQGPFCEKEARARVAVSQDPPNLTGFSVSLFPRSLNVRDYGPVEYRFRIENHDSPRTFTLSINMPPEMSTDFQAGDIEVPMGQDRVVAFNATPAPGKDFYVIRVNAESGGATRYDAGTLNVDEMLGDARMSANDLQGPGIDAALEDFQDNYATTGYGQDLQAFTDLQGILDQSRQNQTGNTTNGNGQNGNGQDGQEPGGLDVWIIIIVVAVVVVALLVYALRKSGKPPGEGQEYI